jgi:hypothetical protein
VALADSKFPPLVEAAAGMPCTPQCTICHKTNDGGFGTLRQTTTGANGLGVYWKANYGLDPGSTNSVGVSVTADQADKVDVDGDGISDYDELHNGTDPNDPSPGAMLCVDAPQYGCGARVAAGHSIDGAASVLSVGALIALALVRRRKAKRAG